MDILESLDLLNNHAAHVNWIFTVSLAEFVDIAVEHPSAGNRVG